MSSPARRPFKSFVLGALVALYCLAPPLAVAEENYDLFKYGSLSCDEWIRHSDLTEAETPNWLSAFLTQLFLSGGYRVDILGQIKSDEIMRWVDGYCRAHPLDGFAVAGAVLTNELSARAAAAKK